MGYDGSLKFDTRIDESGFNSGINKLGSIAKKGLAVLAGAVAGCAVSVTKSSLDMVSSLEQNVGGIETLFKDSADTVIANANQAFATAGMSANDYMSTVTSYAASLLQSLSGDTEEAARVADMALVDMSDNANKMGTSMELIQNAYQGFAKQNYTMLDNLKLGYGGTKTEMERLLADAEKLSGVEYDISNLNDVFEAIHVIQTELGITGTTAKEAATTIEGSMKSAKAALDNFLAGSGTADELVETMTTATEVILKNIGEIVPRLAETVPVAAKGIAEGFANAFQEQGLAQIGMDLMKDFLAGLYASAPQVAEKAGDIVSNLVSGIQENAPTMLTAGVWILASFISGIAEQLPELVPQALQMVATLADAIIANIPTIVSAGIALLTGLVQGLINGLPTLIAEGPRIINDFANAIYSALGQLITTGFQLIVSLVQGLWDNRGLLLENAGEIFMAFLNIFSLSNMVSLGKNLLSNLKNGIKTMLPNIKSAGKDVLTNLVNGIKALATHPVDTVKGIIASIKTAFTSFSWSSIGQNIISGIASGLRKYASTIVSAAKSAAAGALTAAKEALGIHSPSAVFRDQVGKNMALGMGVGFEKNLPVEAMEADINTLVKRAQKKVSVVATKEVATTAKGSKDNPVFKPENPKTDWDEWERRQRKLNKERDSRPIFLGTERIDKPLPKGAVPAL